MAMEETRTWISSEMDVARAVVQAQNVCTAIGLGVGEAQRVATAVSELAHNIVKYATEGEIILRPVEHGARRGVEVVARDDGPGIRDLEEAMQDHFSSSGTLGLGLPGVKRMMDDFEIESEPGRGTRVTIRKWR